MDWLRALSGILITIALAVLLGWSQKTKNPLSPFAQTAIWIGCILALLALRVGFTRAWEYGLLTLAVVFSGLEHIPSWLIWIVMAFAVGLFLRHVLLLIDSNIIQLAREIERTNERLNNLENSVRDKLDDIDSRLPERDEPEYLKELRKGAFRD